MSWQATLPDCWEPIHVHTLHLCTLDPHRHSHTHALSHSAQTVTGLCIDSSGMALGAKVIEVIPDSQPKPLLQ